VRLDRQDKRRHRRHHDELRGQKAIRSDIGAEALEILRDSSNRMPLTVASCEHFDPDGLFPDFRLAAVIVREPREHAEAYEPAAKDLDPCFDCSVGLQSVSTGSISFCKILLLGAREQRIEDVRDDAIKEDPIHSQTSDPNVSFALTIAGCHNRIRSAKEGELSPDREVNGTYFL